MIVEFLVVLTYFVPGVLILWATGLRGHLLAPFGFVVGSSLYTAIGVCQLMLRVTTAPVWTLVGTWLIAAAIAYKFSTAKPSASDWAKLAAVIGAIAAVIGVVRETNVYTWHSDSLRYAQAAGLIARDQTHWLTMNLLTKRMAAYPMLQAPARLAGDYFLRSYAPVLALATVWTVVGVTAENLRHRSSFSTLQRRALSVILGLLLITNSRFLWNATNVNGHLMTASYLLVLCVSSWARLNTPTLPSQTAIVLQSASAMGLVLVRAEGPFLALFGLIPSLCCTRLPNAERKIPLLVMGVTCTLWHGYVSLFLTPSPKSSLGLVALGLIASVATLGLTRPKLQPLMRWGMHVVELGLWLALGVLLWVKPQLGLDSLKGMYGGLWVGRAGWGSSVSILCTLSMFVVVFTRSSERHFLRFAVTTFLPLSLLFAYMRQAPYHQAWTDSLARSFVHIVPLMVVFIGTAFASQWSVNVSQWLRRTSSAV